jgi:hypothetical protein
LVAFRLDALLQAVLHENRVDLDSGLPGESLEDGLDQAWFTRRIDIDLGG